MTFTLRVTNSVRLAADVPKLLQSVEPGGLRCRPRYPDDIGKVRGPLGVPPGISCEPRAQGAKHYNRVTTVARTRTAMQSNFDLRGVGR